MYKRLQYFFIFSWLIFFSSIDAFAQPGCLSISTSLTDATCFGGNDGKIQLTITPGAINAQPPFSIDLFFKDSGGGNTQLASYTGVAFTTITFTPGNGSLNVIGANSFGIPANASVDPGSTYFIVVGSTAIPSTLNSRL